VTKARRKRCSGHVERKGENKNVYKVLMMEHERKRPIGKPRHIEENNIKKDLTIWGWKT
jgi:hypothetical protein